MSQHSDFLIIIMNFWTDLCTYQYYAPLLYGTLVGINHDLHMNFDSRCGPFDLSPHNLCHEVRMAVKKVVVSWHWENQKEAEWLPSLEEGKIYTEIFQSFLMSSGGRKFTCR